MKTKTSMVAATIFILWTGVAFAQMGGGHMGSGGGHMGSGGGHMGGGTGGNYAGGSHMNGGMGYGMAGAGGMVSGMMGNTMSYGYLDEINPLKGKAEALAAIQDFITSSNSGLQISELWEYGTVYKAKLSDSTGAMAFDLIADKFTGAVTPEMGLSMMLNASYGRSLYKMPTFGRNLNVTPDQAAANAQGFVNKNGLGYTLGTYETYPGYYKFHTIDPAGKFGMDIMVSGYNGEIWMNSLLGVPVAHWP